MTERTSLTDADLDRMEAEMSPCYGEVDTLIAEVRRLRAAQTTTLVACSRCGLGFRPIAMAAPDDDERLCVECAEDELRRLRGALRTLAQAVIVAYDYLEQRNETDAVHALDDVYDIALHLIDGLTIEQLREWLAKRRASMLTMESATSDHAQAELYRIKAHELLTIINAIDRGELPS